MVSEPFDPRTAVHTMCGSFHLTKEKRGLLQAISDKLDKIIQICDKYGHTRERYGQNINSPILESKRSVGRAVDEVDLLRNESRNAVNVMEEEDLYIYQLFDEMPHRKIETCGKISEVRNDELDEDSFGIYILFDKTSDLDKDSLNVYHLFDETPMNQIEACCEVRDIFDELEGDSCGIYNLFNTSPLDQIGVCDEVYEISQLFDEMPGYEIGKYDIVYEVYQLFDEIPQNEAKDYSKDSDADERINQFPLFVQELFVNKQQKVPSPPPKPPLNHYEQLHEIIENQEGRRAAELVNFWLLLYLWSHSCRLCDLELMEVDMCWIEKYVGQVTCANINIKGLVKFLSFHIVEVVKSTVCPKLLESLLENLISSNEEKFICSLTRLKRSMRDEYVFHLSHIDQNFLKVSWVLFRSLREFSGETCINFEKEGGDQKLIEHNKEMSNSLVTNITEILIRKYSLKEEEMLEKLFEVLLKGVVVWILVELTAQMRRLANMGLEVADLINPVDLVTFQDLELLLEHTNCTNYPKAMNIEWSVLMFGNNLPFPGYNDMQRYQSYISSYHVTDNEEMIADYEDNELLLVDNKATKIIVVPIVIEDETAHGSTSTIQILEGKGILPTSGSLRYVGKIVSLPNLYGWKAYQSSEFDQWVDYAHIFGPRSEFGEASNYVDEYLSHNTLLANNSLSITDAAAWAGFYPFELIELYVNHSSWLLVIAGLDQFWGSLYTLMDLLIIHFQEPTPRNSKCIWCSKYNLQYKSVGTIVVCHRSTFSCYKFVAWMSIFHQVWANEVIHSQPHIARYYWGPTDCLHKRSVEKHILWSFNGVYKVVPQSTDRNYHGFGIANSCT